MSDSKYTLAAGLLFLSAALHVPVLILAFSTHAVPMILAIVLWTLLGLGLRQGRRWVAWIAFFAMLFGMVAAISDAAGLYGIVSTIFWLIFVVDAIAAVVLFLILWAPRRVAAA